MFSSASSSFLSTLEIATYRKVGKFFYLAACDTQISCCEQYQGRICTVQAKLVRGTLDRNKRQSKTRSCGLCGRKKFNGSQRAILTLLAGLFFWLRDNNAITCFPQMYRSNAQIQDIPYRTVTHSAWCTVELAIFFLPKIFCFRWSFLVGWFTQKMGALLFICHKHLQKQLSEQNGSYLKGKIRTYIWRGRSFCNIY